MKKKASKKQQRAQTPAPKGSKRSRPSRVKGQPPHPEKLKLTKLGYLSHQGEGGGPPVEWTPQKRLDLLEELCLWLDRERRGHRFASIKTWCSNKMIWEQRLSEWAREDERAHELYRIAKQIAANILEEIAVIVRNPGGPIFLLKNNHGYTDHPQGEEDEEMDPNGERRSA